MTHESLQNCREIYKEEFVFEKENPTLEDMVFAETIRKVFSPTDGLHGSGCSQL